MNAPHLTRREFIAALGGIVLSFSLAPKVVLGQDPARLPGSLQTNRTLDAWLRINADGSVTVFTGKVELGQGIVTALAQIAAEELDVPLARVTMISGDTGRTPNEGQTAGSQSIEQSGTALRMAGAEVRALLIDLAAGKLGVAADTLKVTDGVIHAPDGRKVGYGELAAASGPQARGNRQGAAEAGRAAQDCRQVRAAQRHPGQGDGWRRLRAGRAASRHGAWPRGAAAALWRQARQLRRGQDQGHAGRHRGGARRQLSRRGGAARGAGHQCAVCADRVRQVVGRLRAARSGEDVRAAHVPAQRGQR